VSVARFAAPLIKKVSAAKPAVKVPAKRATLAPSSQKSADWKKPHPHVAAKYPKGAKQVFDAVRGLFRVYVPSSGVHGVGAFAPTISFQLGAAAASGSSMATLAQAAVNAVNAFVAKNGQPPQVSLPAVLAFQKADAQLTDDGKWGPNSQVAAAYYLNTTTAALPPFAKSFASTRVTWRAPGATAPLPSKPAPKPATAPASKPVTTKAAPKPVAKPTQQIVQHTVTKPDGSKVVNVTDAGGGPIKLVPGAPLPGYTEVGQEPNNPGLPPVPAPSSAKPVGKAKPVKKVATKPVSKAPAALPVSQTTAERPFEAPIPAGSYVAPPGIDTHPQAGPVPIPAGTSALDWERQQQQQVAGGDNSLVWLAMAYLYLRNRKAA
jgi:hypothetical protein